MDWADAGGEQVPRITTAHWARGQMLAEDYRASVHRLLDELSIGLDVKNEKKVLDFITRNGEQPPSACDILRGAGVKTRKEIDATLNALLEDGVIEIVERKTTGRPAKGYRVSDAELSSEEL